MDDSLTKSLIEDMRVRGWARPTIMMITEAVDLLGDGGPAQDQSRELLGRLVKAAEYWEAAQRKAFEEYLEVKDAGWPDKFSPSQPEDV